MQNPTHVELTILEARGLIIRGKYDTNDAFITVVLGKQKFQTSVLERRINPFIWNNETFLLEIPRQGNTAAISVSVYHRRLLGDECLGTVAIHLKDFQPTPSPKLMTYILVPKYASANPKVTVPNSGEITVSVAFKEIVFETAASPITASPKHRSMKIIAKELIQSEQARKPRRTMSIRSIAQALLTEKRSQCTKALSPQPIRRLDSNDNEISKPMTNHFQSNLLGLPDSQFVRVQSARGKINARREIQRSMERLYVTQKVVARPSDSSSDESEEESQRNEANEPEHEPLIDSKTVEILPRRNTAPSSTSQDREDTFGIPVEFRGETKLTLIEMVSQLRKIVQLQQFRIDDLERYIDGRLARIMAKNPGDLEIEDEALV